MSYRGTFRELREGGEARERFFEQSLDVFRETEWRALFEAAARDAE
jgi:hypothetical protein